MSGVMTLPNLVTFSRLLALPGIWFGLSFGACLWTETCPQSSIVFWTGFAFVCAAYAELTDLADGWLARKLGQTSEFGAMLDPLIDSLYRFGAFALLAGAGLIPVWTLMIVAWRDVIVAYARIQLQAAGKSVGARFSGKLKAIVQGVAILALIGASGAGLVHGPAPAEQAPSALLFDLAQGVFWIAALITAWSAFDYAYAAYRASATSRTS
jgi:CDP-diacylglycerol--glycerol-3-phosphate 3-phosphatidyltransferase